MRPIAPVGINLTSLWPLAHTSAAATRRLRVTLGFPSGRTAVQRSDRHSCDLLSDYPEKTIWKARYNKVVLCGATLGVELAQEYPDSALGGTSHASCLSSLVAQRGRSYLGSRTGCLLLSAASAAASGATASSRNGAADAAPGGASLCPPFQGTVSPPPHETSEDVIPGRICLDIEPPRFPGSCLRATEPGCTVGSEFLL